VITIYLSIYLSICFVSNYFSVYYHYLSIYLLGSYCGDDELSTSKWYLSIYLSKQFILLFNLYILLLTYIYRFGVCEEAIHTLFHIHPSPDKILASIITPLYESLTSQFDNTSDQIHSSSSRLARLFFVLGQGTLCSLVFTEKIANESKKLKDKNGFNNKNEQVDNEHDGQVDAMEEEMGMAAAADAEHERIFNLITEKQLVFDSILGKFHPLIAFVVANEKGAFSNIFVREAATLGVPLSIYLSNISLSI
jgi:hypothetical protein